jgi:ribosome recycling factor
LQDILPPATVTAPEALTRDERAMLRTEVRRTHVKAFRQALRTIRADMVCGLQAAQDEAEWLRDAQAEIQAAIPMWSTGTTMSRSNRPPTTQQLYRVLVAHAEWMSRTGQSARVAIDQHRRWMETMIRAEAMDQIREAMQAAVSAIPVTMPALRKEITAMGTTAMAKIQPNRHASSATPMLSTMLRSSATDRDYTAEEVEANRRQWIADCVARWQADRAAELGAYVPPQRLTAEMLRDSEPTAEETGTTYKIHGHYVAATREAVLGLALEYAQRRAN